MEKNSPSLIIIENIFILTESSNGAGENKRSTFLKSKIDQLPDKEGIEPFKRILSLKCEPSFEGPMVYLPEKNYGTRSSFAIKIEASLESSEFYYSNLPPDKNQWVDFKSLLLKEEFLLK